MFGTRSRIFDFYVIQWLVLLIALFGLEHGIVRDGILSAQGVLLGIALGVGRIPGAGRIAGVALCLSLFAIVTTSLALSLDLGGLFGRHGDGWRFLLLMVRILFVGGFYWQVFLRKGYVLSSHGEPLTVGLLRFRLRLFFVLTLGIAIYFVTVENLGGVFYGILLVLLTMLVGLGYATLPLLGSLLSLEPRFTRGKALAYVVAILGISLAVAGFTYQQTSHWTTAKDTWLMAMIEVVWLIGSLLVLRYLGYRLAKESSVSEADSPKSEIATPGWWPPTRRLRTTLFVVVVALSVFTFWFCTNLNQVKMRAQYLKLLEMADQPVVTFAEGDASASPEVKHRIAPHVSEAFKIRNSGGTTVGPKQSSRLSFLREWLGDEPIFIILLNHKDSLETFQKYFPEAMIVVRPTKKPAVPLPSTSN